MYSCSSCFSKMQNAKSTNLAGFLDGLPIHRHFTNSTTKKTLSRDQSIIQHFIHTTGIRCFLSIHRLQRDCDCDSRARCAAAVRSDNTTPPLRPRSLDRLFFVFEFVKYLCICVPSKDPARFVDLGFRIFEKQEEQGYKRLPKETNHNKWSPARWWGDQYSRSIFDAVTLTWISIYNGAAFLRRSYAALYQRQSVSNRLTVASRGFNSVERFMAQRIASRESEWFPCISRDLHSLSQKLADTQANVIEFEQRIDALQTTAASATAATDDRVDSLQSSMGNVT